MKPPQIIALSAVVLAAALVGFLAWRGRQPPVLPADAVHASFVDWRACMSCHGPEGSSPQSQNHPLGNECTRCHGMP